MPRSRIRASVLGLMMRAASIVKMGSTLAHARPLRFIRAAGGKTVTLRAAKMLAMILCFVGGVMLAGALRGTPTTFHAVKRAAIIGLTVSLLQWLVALLSVGGEWFLMCQSMNCSVPYVYRDRPAVRGAAGGGKTALALGSLGGLILAKHSRRQISEIYVRQEYVARKES